jgi:hypothetical protein
MVETSSDRRVFDRFVAQFPVKFRDSKKNFGKEVVLRDISASGARIFTKNRILPDEKISLLVELPDGHEPMDLEAQVVWTVPTGINQWDAGLKLDNVRLMDLHRVYKLCE